MPSLLRRTIVLGLAVLVMGAMGCSSKDKKTNPLPTLSQEDADDLVQQAAMMLATDQGGWLIDVQSTLESTPIEAPPPPLARRLNLMAASSNPIFRTLRDTLVTRAAMTYAFNYLYADTVDSLPSWRPGVTIIDAIAHATGNITTTGFTGFYKHDGDPVTLEWLDVGADTVTCSGVGDDSLFTTFTPTFRTGTKIYNTTSFVDFEFRTLRDPAAHPFPIAGEANAFMFADVLRTPNPDDFTNTIEGTVTFVFDGTQNPLVGVTNEFEGTGFQYRYHVDLKTGAFTRSP